MGYSKKLTFLLLFALLLKLSVLGMYRLYDTTEARYAGIAMRMVLKSDYITPWFLDGIPFLGKPPLSFWATATSFKLFGFSEFAARLPHFLAILLCMFVAFCFVKRFRDKNEALVFCLVFASSIIFWILAGSVMTDAFLLLGITITNIAFFYGVNKIKQAKYWYLFGVGIAVSLLSKGIIGVVISGIICLLYTAIKNKWKGLLSPHFILGLLLAFLLALPWFYLMEKTHPGFIEYFIIGEHFERFLSSKWEGDKYGFVHSTPPFMILVFILLSAPQWVLYLACKVYRNYKNIDFKNDYICFALLMFLVPIAFFSFSKNIIFPYAAPAIIGFSCLVSLFLKRGKTIFYLTFPFVILYFISFAVGIKFFAETDKLLISEFNKKAGKDDILYYKSKPQFNSYFYSQDKLEYLGESPIEMAKTKFIISSKEDLTFANFTKLKCNKRRCLYYNNS